MSDEAGKPSGGGGASTSRRRRRRQRKPGGTNAPTSKPRPERSNTGSTKESSEPRSPREGSGPKRDRSGKRRRARKRGGEDLKTHGERRPRKPDSRERAPGSPAERASATPDRPRGATEAHHDLAFPRGTDPAMGASESLPLDSDTALGPGESWGDDRDAETPDIQLQPDLPKESPKGELDPSSLPPSGEPEGYDGQLSARVANVIAVRFIPAGRLYLYDAGDSFFRPGDQVIVEGEHGKRIATVGTASVRKPPKRTLKRIVRRATPDDAKPEGEAECREYLSTAKDLAKKQGLAIKVFRAQFDGPGRLAIYYACENKTDVRGLGRALGKAIPHAVDLRHTGARDEAKMVGGIGSCGQELCCSTWLPAFVPVSIKNAKEQGLVLNPTKVSGQCGRLKCCLVYEQALYSEMRKGLPKVGKRVITSDGLEGRVIEVDVLHQKIRVGIGRGESKVYGKGEVEPMFASQPQGQSKGQGKKRKGRGSKNGDATETVDDDGNKKDTSNDKN